MVHSPIAVVFQESLVGTPGAAASIKSTIGRYFHQGNFVHAGRLEKLAHISAKTKGAENLDVPLVSPV